MLERSRRPSRGWPHQHRNTAIGSDVAAARTCASTSTAPASSISTSRSSRQWQRRGPRPDREPRGTHDRAGRGGLIFLLAWFGAGLAASLVLVPLCRVAAIRYGCVARPRQDRWHSRPTALFGGVAIAVPSIALGLASPHLGEIALPVGAGALIFLVGLTDDILSLKPSTKLIAEIALASLFLVAGQTLHWTRLPAADLVLTLVWLVGVTNAFNLLDNMDGLCAGVTLIAGAALLAGIAGRPDAAAESKYLAGVLGATAGFLVYNSYPASIFMGDAGSLFLGLTLAAVTLTAGGPAHDRSRVLSIIAAPLLVLLIPI